MLTSRGWWFCVSGAALVVLGVLGPLPPLASLGLVLLLWFAGRTALFYARARLLLPGVQVRRSLRDDRGPVATLWSGRPVDVQVEVRRPGPFCIPLLFVAERVPFAAPDAAGDTQAFGPVGGSAILALGYRLRPSAPGRLRFEGLRARLADPLGLLCYDTFLPAPQELLVLPALGDEAGHPATTKRRNILPPPGIHRLRRPGSGSELLDLRDYLPGDPPRTIAWKVSARRDRLITKEFESEVPLRCTLFVDTSDSVRIGPPGSTALVRLVEVSAAVVQANTAAGDLTGLYLFDEQDVSIVRPARTAGHLVRLLTLLASAAGLAPRGGQVRVGRLLPFAYAFAEEVYPALLRPDLNRIPFGLAWLSPRPAWAVEPRAGLFQRIARWPWIPALVSLPVIIALITVARALLRVTLPRTFVPWPVLAVPGAVLWLTFLLLFRRLDLLVSRHGRREAWRKRLAALLARRHGLGPGGLAALLEDNDLMAAHLQRFLAEHQVPYPVPLYGPQGQYLFAAPGKIEILSRALVQAVSRGHDNELFVLLVDLLELTDRMEPLLQATRVARARHHQVMVICPWPPGLPLPDAPNAAAPSPRRRAAAGDGEVRQAMTRAATLRFRQAYRDVQRSLARLGIPVVCAAREESVSLILDRLERLRLTRRRR